jgi:hypothetical protein
MSELNDNGEEMFETYEKHIRDFFYAIAGRNISERTSRLLPDLQQETKLDILAGLNILASGNANTAKAIVE